MASAAAPDEIAARSASIAAPRLNPLQLLLAACVRFQLLLAACVRFQLLLTACVRFQLLLSIAFVSTASRLRPLRLLLPASCSVQQEFIWILDSTILEHSTQSRFSSTKVARHYSLVPPPRTSHFRYTQTDEQTHTRLNLNVLMDSRKRWAVQI